MSILGQHALVDLHGCARRLLDDVAAVEAAMLDAAAVMDADVVTTTFHAFEPIGLSGVVVISQSHLTVHTWPEYSFAAVDIFTCGARMDVARGVEVLERAFDPDDIDVRELQRGRRRPPTLHK